MARRAAVAALLVGLLVLQGEAAKRRGSGGGGGGDTEDDGAVVIEPIPGQLWNAKITTYLNDPDMTCPWSSMHSAGGIKVDGAQAIADDADPLLPERCNPKIGGNPGNCECFDEDSLRTKQIGNNDDGTPRLVSEWLYPKLPPTPFEQAKTDRGCPKVSGKDLNPAQDWEVPSRSGTACKPNRGGTCKFCDDRIIMQTDRLHRESCTTLGDQMCRKFRRQAALGLTKGSFMWFVVNDKFGDPKMEQYESMRVECIQHKRNWYWFWESNFYTNIRWMNKADLLIGDHIQFEPAPQPAGYLTAAVEGGPTGIIGCRRPFKGRDMPDGPGPDQQRKDDMKRRGCDAKNFLPDYPTDPRLKKFQVCPEGFKKKTGNRKECVIPFSKIPGKVIETDSVRRVQVTFFKGWSCGSTFVEESFAEEVKNLTAMTVQERRKELRRQRELERERSQYRPPPFQEEEYDLDTCFKRKWESKKSFGPLHTAEDEQIYRQAALNFSNPEILPYIKDVSFFISSSVCERRHSLKMEFIQYFGIMTGILYLSFFPWYAFNIYGLWNRQARSCGKGCKKRVYAPCCECKDWCAMQCEDFRDEPKVWCQENCGLCIDAVDESMTADREAIQRKIDARTARISSKQDKQGQYADVIAPQMSMSPAGWSEGNKKTGTATGTNTTGQAGEIKQDDLDEYEDDEGSEIGDDALDGDSGDDDDFDDLDYNEEAEGGVTLDEKTQSVEMSEIKQDDNDATSPRNQYGTQG